MTMSSEKREGLQLGLWCVSTAWPGCDHTLVEPVDRASHLVKRLFWNSEPIGRWVSDRNTADHTQYLHIWVPNSAYVWGRTARESSQLAAEGGKSGGYCLMTVNQRTQGCQTEKAREKTGWLWNSPRDVRGPWVKKRVDLFWVNLVGTRTKENGKVRIFWTKRGAGRGSAYVSWNLWFQLGS
jgi:hypothetical protein